MVLLRLLNSSPGPVVMASSSPTRIRPAATSADTGEADEHGAVDDLPVETEAGVGSRRRSKKPGAASAVRGRFVAGWRQVTRCAETCADRTGVPEPTGGMRPAMLAVSPAGDMLPSPVMKCRPTPPNRSSRRCSKAPGQSGCATPPLVPLVTGWAAYAPRVAMTRGVCGPAPPDRLAG